jgi:hypothetical protein
LNVIVAICPVTSNRISWLGSAVTVALLSLLHDGVAWSRDAHPSPKTLNDLLLS